MDIKEQDDHLVKDLAIYCKLGTDRWHKVFSYDQKEVTISSTAFHFSEIWNQKEQKQENQSTPCITKSWNELRLPLPDAQLTCWGYASTYITHPRETFLQQTFRFHKSGPAQNMFSPIRYRPHMDYEAEIGILMNRHDPNRFGYVMVNDLTDRGVQARTFNKENPAPGFSEAKKFKDSLRVGPLLMVGDEALWSETEITLLLNNEIRQRVYGKECFMRPGQFHRATFSTENENEWILIASGTSSGVIFHTPNTFEKILMFLRSGFNRSKAVEKWFTTLHFLKIGDEIEFQSPLLGTGKARVTDEQ